MKVLVACEESQRVCVAFRKRGHEAYSCDIIEPSGGHPEWHIHGDVLPVLRGGVLTTMDGNKHDIGKWDLIIAHPPCTYLTNAGTRCFSLKRNAPENVIKRWEQRARAAVFFMQLAAAECPRIAIENPIGFMNTAYRKADQIIHPYMFAKGTDDKENYFTKATCLWLKGLPKLKGNELPKPDNRKLYGEWKNGKPRNWTESTVGSKARSKTFKGIAEAMAEQWG